MIWRRWTLHLRGDRNSKRGWLRSWKSLSEAFSTFPLRGTPFCSNSFLLEELLGKPALPKTAVLSGSVVSSSLRPQAPLSVELFRQEYWIGLAFPSPGDLPDPRIKPVSLAFPALAGRFFSTVPPGELITPPWRHKAHYLLMISKACPF